MPRPNLSSRGMLERSISWSVGPVSQGSPFEGKGKSTDARVVVARAACYLTNVAADEHFWYDDSVPAAELRR